MSEGTKILVWVMILVALGLGMAAFAKGFPGKGETVEQIPPSPSATAWQ